MRARAVAVNFSAATVNLGTVSRRTSSVMVAIATRVLSGRARRARRERERGGRLIRLVKRRRRTTALKGADVRPVIYKDLVFQEVGEIEKGGGIGREGEVRVRKR